MWIFISQLAVHVDQAPLQFTFGTQIASNAKALNAHITCGEPPTTKPLLHDMLQLAPCAKVPSEEQLPRLPLVGADSPVQLAGSHTTELDTVPALHDGC